MLEQKHVAAHEPVRTRYNCQLGKLSNDLILTCNLGTGIHGWKVGRSLSFSDHNTISYTVATEILELPPIRPWAKSDWGLFEEELEKHEWNHTKTITEKKLNQMVDRLTRVLTNALNKACPLCPACTVKKNMVHSTVETVENRSRRSI